MLRTATATTAKGKRVLEDREPQVHENPKTCLFLKGHSTSQIVNDVLHDLSALKKPHSIMLTKKNKILPFEDISSLEFISKKNDASMFVLGNHTKKRPNNLIIGRMFDHQLLDMLELQVINYKGLAQFVATKCHVGSKPLFIFQGEQFHLNGTGSDSYSKLANLVVDLFKGEQIDSIDLQGLEYVIAVSALSDGTEGTVQFKVYSVKMEKSATKLPRIELDEMGPSMELKMLRSRFSTDEMKKASLKRPKELVSKKIKNVEKTELGDVMGRVYVEQDLNQLQTRKVKALKKTKTPQEKSEQNIEIEQ